MNVSAHFPLSFYPIMYFLSGQRGLISITLRQNGINSLPTSLQGHRWRLSSANQMRCLGEGGGETSLIIIPPLFRCVLQHPFFISRHSLIYFLQKMNSSPLTVNTRITKITNTEINYRARPRKSKCSLVSLLAAPIFTPIV